MDNKGNLTFTMIKPDAVLAGTSTAISKIISEAGFKFRALKMTKLTQEQAERFYSIHKDKPFFNELINFMTSGPIIAAIIEKENAVENFRELIGATNPANAKESTIRKLYGTDNTKNAVHGSDCDENAIIESNFFFSNLERY